MFTPTSPAKFRKALAESPNWLDQLQNISEMVRGVIILGCEGLDAYYDIPEKRVMKPPEVIPIVIGPEKTKKQAAPRKTKPKEPTAEELLRFSARGGLFKKDIEEPE